MPQVSVIILTYNPDNTKLRQTLYSAVNQRDVELEIIISDDGSANKDFSFLPDFMSDLGITEYQLLEHAQNHGTVYSCLQAVSHANGEYVFLTSPGDLLFDEYVLRDLYNFAQVQSASLCFGNPVFYVSGDTGPSLSRTKNTPLFPQIYDPKASLAQIKNGFCGGQWVIGACYFRSKSLALRYLEHISDSSIYMEDTPSTAFALADGHRLCYFDRNLVWYEDGSGVSTGSSNKWKTLLHKDLLQSMNKLKTLHPHDPYVDVAWRNIAEPSRKRRLLKNILRHPLVMLRIALMRQEKKSSVSCSNADLHRLTQLLNIK